MKKKIIYAALVIACISFFSFRDVECNAGTALQKCSPKKLLPAVVVEEADFSPVFNLLKI